MPEVAVVTPAIPLLDSVEKDTRADDGSVPVVKSGRPAFVTVPILMYHNFNDAPGPYSVRPAVFQAQLQALKAAGFVGVTISEVADALDEGRPLPARAVAISMDDARATQRIAIEVLKSEGFTATLFVPTGWHELSRDEVVAFDHEGFEIGSHTVWHPNLVRMPLRRVEISQGKEHLEAWLGHPVAGFAYPFGAYHPADVEEVQRVGFRYAVTVRAGARELARDRYEWPRIRVSNDNPAKLVAELESYVQRAQTGQEPLAPGRAG